MKSVEQPNTEADPKMPLEGLIISNEAGLECDNPPWQLVEQVLNELDPGSGNSFCCLQGPDSSYVQTLRGFNGYHLEWRVITATAADGYIHYRASNPGGSRKQADLRKHDFVSSGEQRDLIRWADVVEVFRAFYQGDSPPAIFDWRPLDV